MKILPTCLLLFLSGMHNVLSAQVRKVLFIGNSYTNTNNLPQILQNMASASGDSVYVDQSAPGGYTFQQHVANATTISKINAEQWDYVVLQEQSQNPSLSPAYVNQNVIPYALQLDSMIEANDSCSQTLFFMTWGRKYGDASNCASYPPVCTFSGMQQRLKESYVFMADTSESIVAPVGEAFRLSMLTDTTHNLYQSDNSHPSLEGSYLAACVFYETIMHKTCIGNSYWAGLSANTAQYLQNIANQVVNDSLNVWNLGIYEPWAYFDWQETPPNSGTCVFTQYSSASFTHFWDFGDGNTSVQPNPVHQYTVSMYYPVAHTVSNGCVTDSVTIVNNIIGPSSGISPLNQQMEFLVSPNPADEFIYVKTNYIGEAEIIILDVCGRIVLEQNLTQEPIFISRLSEGIYFLAIKNKTLEEITRLKFIRNGR